MEIFGYLKEDSAQIKERLDNVVKNYSMWPQDRVFEETKKVLESMKGHLQKDNLLLNNIKAVSGLESVLDKFANLTQSIKTEVDNLVMIHVDEPGFEQGLESIDSQWNKYLEFCKEKFYPAAKERLSKEDAKRVNSQLSQAVLS